MPQQGLRFEDLLRSQERLAAQGDKTAAASVQRLQEMERNLKVDNNSDRIADATEKTAENIDSVNNNVAKLAQAIKGVAGGAVMTSSADMPPTVPAERVTQATVDMDTSRPKGMFEGFKELGSLKGWFDTSGPSKGMLDDIIRRRIAKTDYEETQQQVEGARRDTLVSEPSESVQRVQNTFAATAGVTPATFQAPVLASREAKMDLLGSSEEEQIEQQRLWQEEIDILNNIEQNTRAFATVGESIDKLSDKMDALGVGAAAGAGSGILVPPMGGSRGGKPGAPAGKPGTTGKPGAPGTPAGKPGAPAGSRIGSFLKRAPVVGTALAVGAGAYSAYQGFTSAGEEESQKLDEIAQLEATGEVTPEQAEAMKKEVVDVTDVKQSEAVGGGTGMAAGALLGAKAGATIGTFIGGPIGTVVGGAVGGLAGAVAGSSVGKDIARWGAKGFQATRDFFGGKKPEIPQTTTQDESQTKPGLPTSILMGPEKLRADFSQAAFAKNDPANYKDFVEYKADLSKQIFEERQKRIPPNANPRTVKRRTEMNKRLADNVAHQWAMVKFKPEIEKAGAGKIDFGPNTAAPSITHEVPQTSFPRRRSQIEAVQSEGDMTAAPVGPSSADSQPSVAPAAPSDQGAMATPGTATPSTPQMGQMVYTESGENAAAAVSTPAPTAPVIVNAPTNVQQTSNYGPKSPPRNTESSYQQYNRSKFAY